MDTEILGPLGPVESGRSLVGLTLLGVAFALAALAAAGLCYFAVRRRGAYAVGAAAPDAAEPEEDAKDPFGGIDPGGDAAEFYAALLPLSALPLLAFLMRRRTVPAFPGTAGLRAACLLRVRLLPLLPAMQAAGLALVVLAAAGPHTASRAVPVEEDTRAIFLAIDTSESMRALDMSGHQGGSLTRLEVALESCGAFIRRREGDRIGLIAFGGRAVTQCPLTVDHDLARWLLGEIRVEMLGKRTAIGNAIALAAGRIGEGGGAAVLLSDGANTAGRTDPAQAARVARSRGVRVHTIAVGAGGDALVHVRLPSGRTVLRTKRYPPDEQTLREVAALSGGGHPSERQGPASWQGC